MDKAWMYIEDRLQSNQYGEGVKQFIAMAQAHAPGSDRIRCPCRRCRNMLFHPFRVVEDHLLITGIDPNYNEWIFHGEEESLPTHLSNEGDDRDSGNDDYIDNVDEMLNDIWVGSFMDHEARNSSCDEANVGGHTSDTPKYQTFEGLLDDARHPLYPSCTKFSKLSFIVKLLHIKCVGGWTVKSFDMVIKLLKAAFPDALFLDSYHEACRLERGLGFTYKKIHACPNDCVMFWKENADKDVCPKCNASRWVSRKSKQMRIPQKIMRCFPLKTQLQRLFMLKNIAEAMRWHVEERGDDPSFMRHPADSRVWKEFDTKHAWFSNDARNVRLGLASDGFNPFNNMSRPYNIWPVLLVPYNLSPWLCMKDPYMIMSSLIPGPKAPGNDIDVFLRPLVAELKELWEKGIDTYDSFKSETFRLHATLLWMINDFPAYSNLFGWSTKGKMTCPTCNVETDM
ncbi:uncharacterized protein LOC121249404 [Juglans microcarpa x Juglans regia]|uniref:uncharacterized protein LOC121249404 n=1 Tax=Juglans microcarpa x Juglans regia TaxID=2249226 RepID=UPI001B7F784A|nr:uncharacterized protein LOC121249404 [Juglans microcarpa x Juglans regia]